MFYIMWEELHLFPVEHIPISSCVSVCSTHYFSLWSCQMALYFKPGVGVWRLQTHLETTVYLETVFVVSFPAQKLMRYCE